jgi:hypothetical protein
MTAEGPDREALAALVNRWQIRANASDDRRVAYMLRFCADELTDALLPTPPAPGVWHGEVRNKSMPTYGGCSCGKPWPCPDAPGGGEGLRAEVERLRDKWDAMTVVGLIRHEVVVALDAALAARDTDQGAGAGVLPLCPVCREPVELWADLHGEAQADCTACDWQTEVAL